MYKKIAKGRKFLNPSDDGCLACVGWHVGVYVDKAKMTYELDAALSISEEGKHHYVSRPAHLKPLRVMRQALDGFEQGVAKAHKWGKAQGYTLERGIC